jgi:hypothetical protein
VVFAVDPLPRHRVLLVLFCWCCCCAGAKVQSTVYGLTPDVLGTCGNFEERQVGAERYNVFKECHLSRSATIVLRGGAEQFIDESERSIHGVCLRKKWSRLDARVPLVSLIAFSCSASLACGWFAVKFSLASLTWRCGGWARVTPCMIPCCCAVVVVVLPQTPL